MGTRLTGTFAVLAALLHLVSPAAADPAPESLRHAGRWITDDRGRVMILHGFNVVAKSPPYTAESIGFGADDAAFLAGEGFNTVRLGVSYAGVEPTPGQYDEQYLAVVRSTVRMLGQHGIYVLLDFHQDMYNERFGGHGFPDWAVYDDGLAHEPDYGHPANYFVMPGLQRAFQSFWFNRAGPGSVGLQDRFAAAWRRVAEHVGDEPNLVGYDLLNEPWPPGTRWTACLGRACEFDSGLLTDFVRRVTVAIRTVDLDTLVWYEPNQLFNVGAPTSHGGAADPNAGFTYHHYCSASTCDRQVSANAAAQSDKTGDALLMSEFGATDDPQALRRVAHEADRNMTSWQNWTYYNAQSRGRPVIPRTKSIIIDPLLPPTPDNVVQNKLNALARPYPRLIAGTPESFGFDYATDTFELSYSTTAPGAEKLPRGTKTEVIVPSRQYPRGFEVHADGARVVGSPDPAIVRLLAEEGVERVTVRIVPAG
jgi:endoglycosylceramidase